MFVVGAQIKQDSCKLLFNRPKQNSNNNINMLHIFRLTLARQDFRLSANLKCFNIITNGYFEVHALSINVRDQTLQVVLNDRAVSWLHHEDEVSQEEAGAEEAETQFAHSVEESFHVLFGVSIF